MKKILTVIILTIAGFIVWKVAFGEPEAIKAYNDFKESEMASRGFSKDLVAQRKWSMEIENFKEEGSKASFLAIEKTYTIPRGAASFTFATIVTRKLEVKMELEGSIWRVINQEEISKDVSTYEDRKK